MHLPRRSFQRFRRGSIYAEPMFRFFVHLLIALVLVLVSISTSMASTQAQQEKLALDLLGQLSNTAPQNYQAQRRLLVRIIDQCPDTMQAHDAYWQLAEVYKRYMGLPDHTAIAELFEKYLRRYPKSLHAPQAKRDLIYSYEKLKRWDKVAEFYKQTLEGRQLTDSEIMLDGLSYAQALERTGKKSEASRWYTMVLERDRGMNSYAAQIARRRLNYLAADGVVEPPPGPQSQAARTKKPQPEKTPPAVQPPPPSTDPDTEETIEIIAEATEPPARPTATPAPALTATPAMSQPGLEITCKLIKARSFRDTVGRGANRADGSPDAHLRLKFGPGGQIITCIELRAAGPISGYWSTAPAKGAWPMNVLRSGKPAGGAGQPLYLALNPNGEKLDLLIQDNNSIASGAKMTLNVTTAGGSRYQIPVHR